MGRDLKNPKDDLLVSNPLKYWEEKVKYTSRVRDNTNEQLNLMKNSSDKYSLHNFRVFSNTIFAISPKKIK